MRDWFRELRSFFRKGDMVLLTLCLITSAYSSLIIASATNASKFGSSTRYIVIHVVATLIGLLAYAIMSSINLDFLAEHRAVLAVLNVGMLLLLIPFGTDAGTENRSWLDFPFLPVNIQPAEICKIFFIVILASVMSSRQNRISKFSSVLMMAGHLILLVAANMILSKDLGVTLIFVFIFLGMAFAGGVNLIWFLLGIGAVAFAVTAVFAVPAIRDKLVGTHWYERIMMFFDPSIDPYGKGVRWHTNLSLQYVQNGGVAGRGLFQGTMVQGRTMPAQHTDFIFSSIAEELGLIGCVAVLLMLAAIVTRIIYVGVKSGNYMNRIICIGIAGMLLFQIMVNVGMCLGLFPVIGLTLPFISYGGSSIVTMFMAMGVVSGIHMRPAPDGTARYIRPKTMLS